MICRVCQKIVKTEDPLYKSRRVCKECLPSYSPKYKRSTKMLWATGGVCPTTNGGVWRNYHRIK